MIFGILLRVLRASPSLIAHLLEIAGRYSDIFDARKFMRAVTEFKPSGAGDILAAVFVVWMARRFFAANMQGLNSIFRRAERPRALLNQLMIFAGELILIVSTVVMIFAFSAAQTLFTLPAFGFLRERFPRMLGAWSKAAVKTFSYFLVFIFVSVSYRFASRAKPRMRLCVLCAALCALLFSVASLFIDLFLNLAAYNVVYGVLSGMMILLLKTNVFFILYLAFAQAIYARQFFNSLLLGALYLLPASDDMSIGSAIRRALFITPATLADGLRRERFKAGCTIFAEGDESAECFYVLSGAVEISGAGEAVSRGKGEFFGERDCVLRKPRTQKAEALSDCELLAASADDFRALVESDPKAAEKALALARRS